MVPTINGGEPPKPMPMAIMRNAHEVIRGGMKDIQTALDKNRFQDATTLYQDLTFFNNKHLLMEEGVEGGAKGLFQMMDDHADGAATKAGLRERHTVLTKLEFELEEHFVTHPDLIKVKTAWANFQKENEAHLVLEESILMPCVQQMVKSGKPVKKLMKTYFMPVLTEDDAVMERFLKFGNTVLERHDGNMPRVRVFDQAFWAVATPAQWEQWSLWIKQSLTPNKYRQVMGEIKLWIDEQNSAWA
ncbi:expressed unknown protein [Seminavis robusta]|uniref:Hemerythrin-like domain-containing protein n=1 Tax=Seminavis robusta TaxID=568900 RepID=A0A9N8DQM6_9STRA|nr:expressed unknown protein [Seminavis robusta]|eukprot:Sro282_g107550.1 n/a (245) ;mRNA; f:60199-60933